MDTGSFNGNSYSIRPTTLASSCVKFRTDVRGMHVGFSRLIVCRLRFEMTSIFTVSSSGELHFTTRKKLVDSDGYSNRTDTSHRRLPSSQALSNVDFSMLSFQATERVAELVAL